MNNDKGFTLMELLVTISIAGIVAMIAMPNFESFIRNGRLIAYTNDLITSLNLARSEAVKRSQEVVVRKTGTNWEDGWQVFVDIDRATAAKKNVFNDDGDAILCEPTEDCLLRTYVALSSPYTLRGNNNFTNFIRYQPDGTSNNIGSFALCTKATPKPFTAKLIIVNSIGRVRTGKDTNNDGIPEKSGGIALASCTSP